MWQRDVIPLLSLYKVNKGEVPFRISRRSYKNVVGMLLLCVDDILHEWFYKGDARALDSLQYTMIITVIGGRVDDLVEGVYSMFSAHVDPRKM